MDMTPRASKAMVISIDAKGIKGHGITARESRQANHARDKRKGKRRERAREEGGGPR
jgi:hypothetical protein